MRRISVGEKTLERERERAPTYLYDLRRSVGRNSSGQERKFIYSTRATCGYQKKRDFALDSSEEFRKSKVSSLGSVHRTS